MSPNDKKADPHEQTSFIEQMSRSGHFHLWGFRGYAPAPEMIPVEHACTLEFAWNARPSEVDDQLGQLELFGANDKLVWSNVHFYEAEIEVARLLLLALLLILLRLAVPLRDGREMEAARPDFVASSSCEEREIKPKVSPDTPALEAARIALRERYPAGDFGNVKTVVLEAEKGPEGARALARHRSPANGKGTGAGDSLTSVAGCAITPAEKGAIHGPDHNRRAGVHLHRGCCRHAAPARPRRD